MIVAVLAALGVAGFLLAQQPAPKEVPRHSYHAANVWIQSNLPPTGQMFPDSTAIHHAIYFQDGGFLVLRFQSDPSKSYLFEGVPLRLWREFEAAPSKGRFYNDQIKGRYRFQLR